MPGLSRRLFLAGLGAGAAVPVLAAPSAALRPRPRPVHAAPDLGAAAAALIARSRLGGEIAFAVADAASGEMLGGLDPDRPMAPASTAKTLTATYALDHLGPAYRFVTRLIGTGPLRQGRLEGDLVLAGGGDPVLDTDGLADLLGQLAATGVQSVAGGFRVWDRALPYIAGIDPGQPDHLGYNPAVSGLNLNFNRVFFQWQKRGAEYAMTMDARTDHVVPPVRMVTMATAERGLPIYTFDRDPNSGREAWTVARSALGPGGSRWLPVRGTARYAGEVLRTLAVSQRPPLALPVPDYPDALPEGVPLARHLSPPLTEVIDGMLTHSTNLTAEAIGMTATAHLRGTPPTSLQDSATEMSGWLRGLGLRETMVVDHSGLNPASRVTAADMVRLLAALGPTGPLLPLMKTIGLKTPANQPEPFTLVAKTGTLNFVSCLVGYILRPQGAPLAFAVLTAEPARRSAILPGDEEMPPGAAAWASRSRSLQFDLVRLWARNA